MSAKPILERDGKTMISEHLAAYGEVPNFAKSKCVSVFADTDMDALPEAHPWLLTTPLVAKIDQGVKRRGKLGLIKVNTDFAGAKEWIKERVGKVVQAGEVSGRAQSFIIEPCLPHDDADEMYVSFYGTRQGQAVLFYHQGGIDVGDVDAKVNAAGTKVEKQVDVPLTDEDVGTLLAQAGDRKAIVAPFLRALYNLYVHLNFTYLEINPLVVKDGKVHVLDLAAKIDETAAFEQQCKDRWGTLTFPAPFGREKTKEELYIAELDARSGASLKLTVLNKDARIWTMVAGGGASVVYADTICDLVDPKELANYGEYSGAPNEEQTYNYARTILDLMTRNPEKKDKVLIIGGGIANFTNVAQTFKGIIHAIKDYQHQLQDQGVRILVRRGGPNYQEGLEMMRKLADTTALPITVKGPETHITAIVRTALDPSYDAAQARPNFNVDVSRFVKLNDERAPGTAESLFTNKTRSVVFGLQDRAIQGMLDFDKACGRDTPSVAAVVYPFGSHSQRKYYWGDREILLPVYPSIAEALQKHPEVSVFVNFASFRSAHEVTLEVLNLRGIKTVAIIAEGIPENRTKEIIMQANMRGVTIIGPATVGGIKPGCFKVGNTGGMLDNNIESLLYRPGSVAYVSRSGGMSNELNNILSKNSDGVFEGVAIGGDRYPCTTFLDHLLRWENTPEVKMMVLLGEVGGIEEHKVAQLMKEGKITKPLVAWCIGTCASRFTTDVQFGHAGALANSDSETAVAKNKALAEAGAFVPPTFDDLGTMVNSVYSGLVDVGVISPATEPPKPKIPMDFNWAKELGLIRKPAAFMSSISDERGDELRYAGVPISEVFSTDMGIGGVLGLLWFKRQLPPYACKFIEMCLMITADHGPAVSGAHNVIVTARAGKDLISALCSGLLTIGDRFGGALDDAARQFTNAFDDNISAEDFVKKMRLEHKLIMGIGHRVKSLENPDMRVKLVKEFVKTNFPSSPILDFAMQVELVTTRKKDTLILNVDGCIAVAFCDLMRSSGCFTHTEANEYIQIGVLNGLFVLGRSLGFIGHWIDQKRLKQDLYRHPWDDIMYLNDFTIPSSPRKN